MDSLFKLLFLAVQARIKQVLGSEVRMIDQDLGQLEYYPENGRPAVSWPCVLLDFDAEASDHHGGVQWLDISMQVRIGFTPYSSASSITPDVSKQAALLYYDIEHAVYLALQGFDAGGLVQPFTRQGKINTEKREDPIRVRVMTFTTATEDDSAAEVLVPKAATLQVDDEIMPPDE